MLESLEKILNKIVKYGLYAILLTPLAFWPKALFPFLTPKFILFQILVEIVFGAWLILFIKRGFGRINGRLPAAGRDLRGNYIVLALSGFLAISFISALFGVDFSRSFWGIGPRMTGLFAELHFFAWFLVLINFFKTKEEWNRYLNFSFFVSIAVALTAFYQNPKWALALGYGIFNNPTFVAPYLIFHFFWGLYQAINLKSQISNLKRWPRWLFTAGTVLLLSVILFAQIRGAVLGLLIGVLILGLSFILSDVLSRRPRIILLAVYVLLIIGLVSFWYLRDNSFVQSFSPIKRVTGISLSETTVQTRLLAWRVAFEGFKSAGWRTFFGTGPENFNYLFNTHYDPHLLKFGGGGFGETWFDKPHNAFLEILSETGIIGSLAYVFIWAAVSLALFKLFRRGPSAQTVEKFLSLILASAFITYFSAVFFSFDSFGSWFGLFLFLAFLVSHRYDANIQMNTNDTNKIRIISMNSYISIAIVAIIVFILLWGNYSIWRANIADADALRVFSRDPSAGLVLFDKSFKYFTPYKDEYQFDMVASIVGALQKNVRLPNPEETINFALEAIDKAITAHPKNAAYYTDLVKIYNILGGFGRDPQILAQAETFGEKSLELSPNRQETLYYLTQTVLLKGDTKTAVALARQALELDSSVRQSHWYFGLALIADGRQGEGVAEIKKALEMGYKPQNMAEQKFVENLGL